MIGHILALLLSGASVTIGVSATIVSPVTTESVVEYIGAEKLAEDAARNDPQKPLAPIHYPLAPFTVEDTETIRTAQTDVGQVHISHSIEILGGIRCRIVSIALE